MLFLFAFLPLFFTAYFLVKDLKKKNYILIAASLLFYLFGGLKYLVLALTMTGAGYYAGLKIEKEQEQKKKKRDLILSTAFFLAVLCIFKYTGFAAGTLGVIFHTDWTVKIALPLGISFYTFKLISYTADVYSGKTEAEKNFADFTLYLIVFHQILQGPIVRYADMKEEIKKREVNAAEFSGAVYRFCIGLAKKAILADHLGEMADLLLPPDASAAAAPVLGIWLGSLCYTMQLYLDFSAYTDMAIALGRMAGFHYPENFNYPYLADSAKDFWRRWHITLSTFFRDYVYIPLGGNRKGEKRRILSLLAVWLLTGLWHGASWNFVLWGLYYFCFICLENYLIRKGRTFHPVIKHIYALFVINFGWILFRFTDPAGLAGAAAGFFGLGDHGFSNAAAVLAFRNNFVFLFISAAACTPLCSGLERRIMVVCQEKRIRKAYIYGVKTILAALLLALSACAIAGNSYRPFLYNRF
ncbi:MAG: MBOAT family O-acyltransferase [Eubacterium sp.]|nr:MBOAT family O-acyltransferase [Eubacterium sp.]